MVNTKHNERLGAPALITVATRGCPAPARGQAGRRREVAEGWLCGAFPPPGPYALAPGPKLQSAEL